MMKNTNQNFFRILNRTINFKLYHLQKSISVSKQVAISYTFMLSSIKLRHWIFLIFIIDVIVKQAVTLSTVQNIKLLDNVTPADPQILLILKMQFGSSQSIFYVSSYDYDFNQRVRQYQIIHTAAAGQITVLTKTYLLANQFQTNDKITQIADHLIIHSQSGAAYQVFDLASNDSFVGYDDGYMTYQFLYSAPYDLVILIRSQGILQAVQYDSFVLNDFTLADYFDTTNSFNTYAQLSYDGQYLVVGSFDQGLIQTYSISSLTWLNSFMFYDVDATKFVWHPDNFLYIYTKSSGNIYKFTPEYGFQYVSFILPSDGIYKIYSFSYAVQSNQLLMFYEDNSDLTSIRCSTFNLDLSAVTNTFYFYHDDGVQLYGPKFSYNTSSTAFYAFIWSDTFYKRFQVITAQIIPNNNTNANSAGNDTLNAAGNLNSANLTNSSGISNLTNSSFSTTNSSFNSSNSSLINNFTSQDSVNFIQQLENLTVYQNYKQLISNSLNSTFLQYSNQAPASRKIIKPIFVFFSNFDDLWLYSYHHKNYHPVLTQTFSVIRNLQVEKWNTFNYEPIYQNLFELNVSQIMSFFSDQKLPYSSQKFIEVQNDSNGYISNTLNFYFQCLIILLVTFVMGRLAFILLSHWKRKLKNLFIQFSFTLYFVIICLEGNVQYMSYLFGFEMKTLFHKTFTLKSFSCMIILMQFMFLLMVLCIYYLIKYAYESKANNILENCSATKFGVFYLTLQFGIKNVILGFVHMFFQNQNYLQIAILLLIESIFLGFSVYFSKFKKQKCFIKKSKQWILIFTTCIRILLVSTFLLQVDFQQMQIEFSVTDFAQLYSILLILYMSLWPFSILLQLQTLFLQFVALFEKPHPKKQNSQIFIQKCPLKNKQVNFQGIRKTKNIKSNYIIKQNNDAALTNLNFNLGPNPKSKQQKDVFCTQINQCTEIKNKLINQNIYQKLKARSFQSNTHKDLKQATNQIKRMNKIKRKIKLKAFDQLRVINNE